MSLTHEEERVFRELRGRLPDVNRSFARSYAAWHAPTYVIGVAFLLGTMAFVAGVAAWWPLAVVGAVLSLTSCLAGVLHGWRRNGGGSDTRPRSSEAWTGLMR